MESSDKPHEEGRRGMTVTWPGDQWEQIEAAARAMTESEHFTVTPTDIIRSGAVRRAEEILSGRAA